MRPVEVSWSGIAATAMVMIVVAVCVRLGIWQLDRRDQRLARNTAVAERMATDTVRLTALPGDTSGLSHRPVLLRGAYDHDRAIVLAGRSLGGTPGVHLFTPVRLGDGAVLVNRGWLPAPDAATVDLRLVDRPDSATVRGLLQPFPPVHLDVEPPGFRTTWFRLAGDAIRSQYPYPVAPLYVVAGGTTAPAERRAPLPLPAPGMDAGPHLSYAVQWFSFAAIFAIGWLVLVLRRREGPRSRG